MYPIKDKLGDEPLWIVQQVNDQADMMSKIDRASASLDQDIKLSQSVWLISMTYRI